MLESTIAGFETVLNCLIFAIKVGILKIIFRRKHDLRFDLAVSQNMLEIPLILINPQL